MERQLQTQPQGQVSRFQKKEEKPVDPRQIKKRAYLYTTADIYRPSGAKKDAYSVNMYRAWANEARINFQMLECEKNNDYVKVSGRAWVSQPGDSFYMERSATVILIYKDMLRDAIMSAITNGVSYSGYDNNGKYYRRTLPAPLFGKGWEMGEDGFPMILDPEVQMAILKEHIKKRNISERIARANVEKIVFSEILNDEDPNEPESHTDNSEGEQKGEINQEEGGDREEPETLDQVIDKIVQKIIQSVGEDRNAQIELFGLASGKALGKRLSTTKAIQTIEEAEQILAAIPEKILDQEDIEDVFPGATEQPEIQSQTQHDDYDPIQAKRDMVKLEVTQIYNSEEGKSDFVSLEAAFGYFMRKTGLPQSSELGNIKTEEQGEKVLQAIMDYHLQKSNQK